MLRKFIASGVQIGIQRELYRNGYSNDQKEMKPVLHRTPSINALYITTEAMTTAHACSSVYTMYFQAAGYTDEYCRFKKYERDTKIQSNV